MQGLRFLSARVRGVLRREAILAGIMLGLLGALALTRVMSSLLYEVSATDR